MIRNFPMGIAAAHADHLRTGRRNAMNAIHVLRLQARLATAEHLSSRVNAHLSRRPDDAQMREASQLLEEAVSRLRHQIVHLQEDAAAGDSETPASENTALH
jgi:hypothetical protein